MVLTGLCGLFRKNLGFSRRRPLNRRKGFHLSSHDFSFRRPLHPSSCCPMNLSVAASMVAGGCYLLAYLDYNRGIFAGRTKPNGATWAIWSAIALVSAGSYLTASRDIWESMLPLVNIVPCLGTFFLALIAGKFKRLETIDWLACAVVAVAAILWAACGSAAVANVVVQVAIVIGFVPIWRASWIAPASEHVRPWWMWGFSYSLAAVVVILRWKDQWIDLVSPALCMLLHSSVAIICHLRTRSVAIERSPVALGVLPIEDWAVKGRTEDLERISMAEMTIPQALELAVGHHRCGRLAEAEALYRQVLSQQPNHSEALRLLGLLARRAGRPEVAVELISRAIAIDPRPRGGA